MNFDIKSHRWDLITISIRFPDECGHPEMPFNGRYVRSNNTVTYYCNEGYQLSASSPVTRHCVRGFWSETQPICGLH